MPYHDCWRRGGDILRKLGKERGILGDIYAGAQSRFQNPVNLKRLMGLIDPESG